MIYKCIRKFKLHHLTERKTNAQSSKQGDSHPLLLTEPYPELIPGQAVNLSIHTALQDNAAN